MTDDHKPPVTSTPVGLIGVSDKDASGYDHKAEACAHEWRNRISVKGTVVRLWIQCARCKAEGVES